MSYEAKKILARLALLVDKRSVSRAVIKRLMRDIQSGTVLQ